MNKSLTIVYPSGAGGDFLCWLLGQCNGFVPQRVNLKPDINKWDIPSYHFWQDQNCKEFLKNKFDKELINVFRDHGWCNIIDRQYSKLKKSIDKFVHTRYDIWEESCFIVLCPKTKKSVEIANKLSLHKLQEGIAKQYIKDETWGIKITEKILKNRNYIIVDPIDLYYNNTEQELRKIDEYMIKHKVYPSYGSWMKLSDQLKNQLQINFFIKIWRDNNPNGLFD